MAGKWIGEEREKVTVSDLGCGYRGLLSDEDIMDTGAKTSKSYRSADEKPCFRPWSNMSYNIYYVNECRDSGILERADQSP